MGCFYPQCPHSLHPPPFCHRTSLICEKHFNTTCPQTELTVWRHAHKDESTHIQRRGSHAGEWKQITGSEERGKHTSNPHRTSTAFTAERNNQPNRRRTMQSHQSTSHPSANTQAMWSQFQVNRGLRPCGALWQGLTWWMLPLSQHRITKEHKLSFKRLPAGIHKVFQQQSSQHSLTPTLWESADRGKEKTSRQTPQWTLWLYTVGVRRLQQQWTSMFHDWSID